ncbi:LytTR family DNA-binding domain-containing protein [Erythrobacter sp. SCSIO 43205]|uniref:LytTR family DNA-binding domain-containing protein n=1 Tax=Erythrobacter sp. SCSIO 43205 TaxID=2779361 RepID=UPI0021064213|nr:LytTR family DNA-binding domain-containing protein [Erythrobacter sp. SCSIO 43205]
MTSTSGNMAQPQELSRKAAFVRGLLTDLAVMTVIGLFLGVLGPFGTIDQSLGVRLVSWLAFAYVGYACYRPVEKLVDWGERELHLPRIGLWLAGVLLASLPMTVAVLALGNLHDPFRWPGLDIALTSYFYVLIVGGAVTFIFNLLGFSQKGAHATSMPTRKGASEAPEPRAPDASAAVRANPLLDALPPALGSDIIALEMEDHYVRVHTALGSELVLMRLRDAMVHVSEIEGRQVHRSWWVARLAVEDVRREGRNVRLVLPGGLEAPVARAQVSELKGAGWL